jgi:hypothetical protein
MPLGCVLAAGALAPSALAAAAPPDVAQFASPHRFWCMTAHPGQAQVTVGWSVPTATAVTVLLDGRPLHQGLRDRLPFAVLAGKADGIGATVVFPCRSGQTHKVTIRWRAAGSAATTRTVTIRKARA